MEKTLKTFQQKRKKPFKKTFQQRKNELVPGGKPEINMEEKFIGKLGNISL